MVSTYLEMLEKSMYDKISILDELTELSDKQRDVVSQDSIVWEDFDKLTDDKAVLVEKLDSLDSGFEATYDRIKDELNANKSLYKEKVQNIQELIKTVTEKSTSLMALEHRNKTIIDESFKNAKQKVNQNKVNSRVASNYYRAMSKVNFIDPQLMDKKK